MKDKNIIIHNNVNNEAVTVKGHRLSDIVEFNEEGVKKLLSTEAFGRNIIFFDSTFIYGAGITSAMSGIKYNCCHNFTVFY